MRETLDNNTTNSQDIKEKQDFSENQYYDKLKELAKSKDNEKIESDKLVTKQKLLLELSDFLITENDFEIINKNNTIIIISNSSYFSSIVWLNWIREKKNARERKNRIKYDNLDKYAKNLYESNLSKEVFKKKLTKHCSEKNLDYNTLFSSWWCVISEWKITGVGLKRFIRDNWDFVEKNKGTIEHESQHIKFNKYCQEKWITSNWMLNLLNEVIAHCTNTKTEEWEIDYEKIYDTMKKNENYITTSWIEEAEEYYSTLYSLIWKVQKELKNNNLDTTMEKLIDKYSN